MPGGRGQFASNHVIPMPPSGKEYPGSTLDAAFSSSVASFCPNGVCTSFHVGPEVMSLLVAKNTRLSGG